MSNQQAEKEKETDEGINVDKNEGDTEPVNTETDTRAEGKL